MASLSCWESSGLSIDQHIIGLEEALSKMRHHFVCMKNYISTKDREIQMLKEQVENLPPALQSPLTEDLNVLPKRRKTSGEDRDSIGTAFDFTFRDDHNSDLKFNMALGSEQLFDVSGLSPSPNKVISAPKINSSPCKPYPLGEANSPRKPLATHFNSPCKLSTAGGCGQLGASPKAFSKSKHSNENLPPAQENYYGNKFDWKEKPRDCPTISDLNSKNAKKNLSLNKKGNVKLKQTRLQLEVTRTKSFTGSKSSVCEDAILPSPQDSSKQLKSSRSWILRSNHSGAIAKTPNKEQTFAKIFKSPENFKVPLNKNKTNADQTTFELRADSPVKDQFNCAEAITATADDSPSVIVCTPASQEIIFLEDTCDYTNIESMELLRELMQEDNNNLTNLKRIESEKVKQLKQQALKSTRSEPKIGSKNIKCCKQHSKTILPIKKEEVPQIPVDWHFDRKQPDESSEATETKEDFMVRPIMVKEEFSQSIDESFVVQPIHVKNELEKKTAENREINIKERFKIDCKDCQKYIDFLGGQLSDKEIEQHLKRCTRHKKSELQQQHTPDDFWNPLLQSFVEDDPRNEVLIDARFVGKRRNL